MTKPKMLLSKKGLKAGSIIVILLHVWLFMSVACSPTTTEGSTEQDMSEMAGNKLGEMEDQHAHGGDEDVHVAGSEQGSNGDQGATIRLISPADGAIYFVDEEIPVEVEVEDFALGEEGGHWHVFVDGTVWGMTSGNDTQQVLLGLEPGMRKIEVSLAGGDHLDLDSSDSVTIAIKKRE